MIKLLDYVAIYGLILMPVGAVVFAERLGGERYEAERTGTMIAWKVVVVWIGTLGAYYFMPLHLYFRWLPVTSLPWPHISFCAEPDL